MKIDKIGNYCQLKAACCQNFRLFRVFRVQIKPLGLCVFAFINFNFLEQIFWPSSLIFLKAQGAQATKIPLICAICGHIMPLRSKF